MSRFEDAGSISEEVAREIGLVGPAARASGLGRDVRTDFPKGVYRYSQVPMCTWSTGDVFARAYVRWLEIQTRSASSARSSRSCRKARSR